MSEDAASSYREDRLVDALASAVSGADLEAVTRPILDALHDLTGLDSTYLTSIRWNEDVQRIEFATNREPGFEIPEGLEVEWRDTLCRRAMESGRVYTDDVPTVWGDSAAAQELGIKTYASAPIVLPDGTTYGTLCGASSRPLPADARTLQLLQVFSRVIADAIARETELDRARRETAWARQQLADRARFLAEAEHKLKTPLAVISGWSRMLLDGRVSADGQDEALRSIDGQATVLGERLQDLLTQARSEIILSEMAPRPVALAELCESVCDDLGILSRSHTLCSGIEGSVQVLADEAALRIVLEHLIENAIKHTDGGEVRCSSEVIGEHVHVTVQDSGPGLPDGLEPFEAFTRGSDRTPGSGLGLHIVRSLTEAMDGQVTAANGDGGGAAFRLVLPVA